MEHLQEIHTQLRWQFHKGHGARVDKALPTPPFGDVKGFVRGARTTAEVFQLGQRFNNCMKHASLIHDALRGRCAIYELLGYPSAVFAVARDPKSSRWEVLDVRRRFNRKSIKAYSAAERFVAMEGDPVSKYLSKMYDGWEEQTRHEEDMDPLDWLEDEDEEEEMDAPLANLRRPGIQRLLENIVADPNDDNVPF